MSERERFSRERIGQALRHLRTSAGLTQRELVARSRRFADIGMGSLMESQVSAFERGRMLPSMFSFLNFLAACSPDGDRVDFARFADFFEDDARKRRRG